MSIKTEAIIQESLGDKLYCSKPQLIQICLDLGIFGSMTGAISALKFLPWIKVSQKRLVIPREIALDYFKNNLLMKSCKAKKSSRLVKV